MGKLTKAQARILQVASAHRNGVAAPNHSGVGSGMARAAWHRAAASLANSGMLEPNAYGDFYITALGRAALLDTTAKEGGK